MTKKLTLEEIRQIQAIKLEMGDYSMALHCKECIDDLINNPDNPSYKKESPQDYGKYEARSHSIKMPDGTKTGVIAIWCKRCDQEVWNSKHLTHRF